jgi:short-subunit dehydrogenase
MAAELAFPMQAAYSAAKHGLRGFGQALRAELCADGIGVSTILPGAVATPFLKNAKSHDIATSAPIADWLMRFGTPPKKVARAVERAIAKDPALVRVGLDSHAVAVAMRLAPDFAPFLMKLAVTLRSRLAN